MKKYIFLLPDRSLWFLKLPFSEKLFLKLPTPGKQETQTVKCASLYMYIKHVIMNFKIQPREKCWEQLEMQFLVVHLGGLCL